LQAQRYRHPQERGQKQRGIQATHVRDDGDSNCGCLYTRSENGLPHNRARLLLARYALRNLNLVPELVADLYRHHLADYCPVINTFNVVSAASSATFGEPWYRL
jgi:hypothetical protein